jgi:ketosteroid isomerase-like protein
MARSGITEADVADLTQRCQDAAAALIRGDVRSYLGLFVHADDYTLIPPFGGAPRHGFDTSEDAVEQLSRFFAGGEAQVDVVQSYVSGDFVVLALIERQHGKVGGLPDQDWSLRVTMLFRRRATTGGWCTGTPTRWCARSTSTAPPHSHVATALLPTPSPAMGRLRHQP